MKTISIRRQGGSAKNGWIKDITGGGQGFFLDNGELVHTANSGNETWEFELKPGRKYLYQEIWYGRKKRETIKT